MIPICPQNSDRRMRLGSRWGLLGSFLTLMAIVAVTFFSTPALKAVATQPSPNGSDLFGFTANRIPYGDPSSSHGGLAQDAGLTWTHSSQTLTATNISATSTNITTQTQAVANVTGEIYDTGTGGVAQTWSGLPTNSATLSLLALGNAIASGNIASNGGTWIGGNAPSSGPGLSADWINFQANGTKVFGVDHSGNAVMGTINGNTWATGTGTLSIAAGKTLTASNSITFAGTDTTTMTMPSTSATIARTDAAQTFVGHNTFEGVTPTGATGTGNMVFATSPSFVTPSLGAASATSLSVTGTNPGTANFGDNAVSQLTSLTTAVTSNTPSGVITTQTATTASQAGAQFTVNCNTCQSTSAVLVSLSGYTGTVHTNGFPIVSASNIGNGSFKINIYNVDATNALNGVLTISYLVI